ncbi:hypothetical protein NDN08_003016 [Rhodosorus marinus]|uniref:GRAM domain-containing protein n=1 Tax=Rhodosorus marinus TaxID=101924 RepID=A0AAV8UY15_9RHOD|nr:hypothetical protein NDN08_003016 [Rhodosorus marinus]
MNSQTYPDEAGFGKRSTSVKGSKLRMTLSRRDSDSFVAYYLCALQKKMLIYQGKLELYTDRLVFTSPVFGGISELYHSSEIVSIQKKGINALLITLDNPDMKEASLISFANRPRAMQRIRGVLGYFPRDSVPKDGNSGPTKNHNLQQSEMTGSESAQPSLEQGSGSSYSVIQLTEPEELNELLHPLSEAVQAEASYSSVISDSNVLELAQAEEQQVGVDATPTPDVAPPSTTDVVAALPPLTAVADSLQTPKEVASEPSEDPGQDEFEEVEEVIEYEVVGDATSLHVILEDVGRAILHTPLAVAKDRLLDAGTTENGENHTAAWLAHADGQRPTLWCDLVGSCMVCLRISVMVEYTRAGKRQWNRQFEFNGQQYDAMVEESLETTADGVFILRGIGGVDQLPGGVIVIEEQLIARDENTCELISRGTVDMGDAYNDAFSKPAMIALLEDRFRVRLAGNSDLEPEILFTAKVDNYDEPTNASVLRTMSTEPMDDGELGTFTSVRDSQINIRNSDRGVLLEPTEFSSPHTLEPESSNSASLIPTAEDAIAKRASSTTDELLTQESFRSVGFPSEHEGVERVPKPDKESTKITFVGFMTSPISVYIIASIIFVFLIVLFFVLVRLSFLLGAQKELLIRAARKFSRPR